MNFKDKLRLNNRRWLLVFLSVGFSVTLSACVSGIGGRFEHACWYSSPIYEVRMALIRMTNTDEEFFVFFKTMFLKVYFVSAALTRTADTTTLS